MRSWLPHGDTWFLPVSAGNSSPLDQKSFWNYQCKSFERNILREPKNSCTRLDVTLQLQLQILRQRCIKIQIQPERGSREKRLEKKCWWDSSSENTLRQFSVFRYKKYTTLVVEYRKQKLPGDARTRCFLELFQFLGHTAFWFCGLTLIRSCLIIVEMCLNISSRSVSERSTLSTLSIAIMISPLYDIKSLFIASSSSPEFHTRDSSIDLSWRVLLRFGAPQFHRNFGRLVLGCIDSDFCK